MFTNEFLDDETITTVLDDCAVHEDIHVFIDSNEVFIRQWNEQLGKYNLITLSHRMWLEVQQAMKTTEGVFIVKYDE